MTIHKYSVKLNINRERGSGTIYLKKDLVEKMIPPGIVKDRGIRTGVDLMAYYDDVKDEILIKEPE